MPQTETVERYSLTQILLHWIIAALVFANWAASDTAERAMEGSVDGVPIHVWIGLAILALVAVRIYVRLTSAVPGPPAGTEGYAARARHWGHILLYVMLVAVPLGGIATWVFGIDDGPHPLAAKALLVVVTGHIIMAFYHQGVKSDGTMVRMLKPR